MDLRDAAATADAVRQVDPGLVLHLAAESQMDRSIGSPGAYGSPSSPVCVYIESNVTGTFNLLQMVRVRLRHSLRWKAAPLQSIST